jgi:2-polyprenyl-3-methyl-5-hydroxy-6-metoxy-1,4-benzoquinol methylase
MNQNQTAFCEHQRNTILYAGMAEQYHLDHWGIHDRDMTVRRCDDCRLVFTFPQLSDAELNAYFNESYLSFQPIDRAGFFQRLKGWIKQKTLEQYYGYGTKHWWRIFFWPFSIPVAHFPDRLEGGTLMDVGCGGGNYLVEAQKLGWKVSGIDPSPISVEVTKKRGFADVREGDLLSVDLPENAYDVVAMFHVFEHVHNPHDALEKAKKILKPGGQLIIGVPNFASAGSAVHRSWWAGLSFPLHYFHYDRHSLKKVLEEHGFTIEKIRYPNFTSDMFVSSIQNRYMANHDYTMSKKMAQIFSLGGFVWGNFDYLIGNMIANAFQCGGQITVVSRNNNEN